MSLETLYETAALIDRSIIVIVDTKSLELFIHADTAKFLGRLNQIGKAFNWGALRRLSNGNLRCSIHGYIALSGLGNVLTCVVRYV